MKENSTYEHFDFAVLRTPLLPMYTAVNGKKRLFISDSDDYATLFSKLSSPHFEEALLISSSDLYQEYLKIKAEGVNEENKSALRKLICYFLRMSARATPYGISAGVSALTISDQTSIRIGSMEEHRKKASINFDYITGKMKGLMKEEAFVKKQTYYANNTVYVNFNGIHFNRINLPPYTQSVIGYSQLIMDLLGFAKHGKHFDELVSYITTTLQQPADVATAFIIKLVSIELLTPDILPSLFSKDINGAFWNKLNNTASLNGLGKVAVQMETIKQESIGNSIGTFKDITESLSLEGINNYLHFTSAYHLEDNRVDARVANDISTLLVFLCKLRGQKGNAYLRQFTRQFEERYGDKQVLLAEALNERTGIGYPPRATPFIKNDITLALKDIDFLQSPDGHQWDNFIIYLLNRRRSVNSKEIILTEEDLSLYNCGLTEEDLSSSLYCTFGLISEKETGTKDGDYLIDFMYAGGPSCINSLNRFSGLGEELEKNIATCAQWENDYYKEQGINLAEINFLPRNGIAGNILQRGNPRQYEIPILTCPTPGKHIIHLNQVYLGLEKGELVATDKETNEKILPVATVLYDNHNTNSVSFNSFLTDLNHQEKIYNAQWDWGNMEQVLDHFPRVCFRNCVLSKETWVIRVEESGQAGREALRSLLRRRNIPSSVYYIEKEDHLLFLNLNNDPCLDILESKLRKYGKVTLVENLYTKEGTFIGSPSGYHANEFILPLRLSDDCITRKRSKIKDAGRSLSLSTCRTRVKLFCNLLLADELLDKFTGHFCAGQSPRRLLHFERVAQSPHLLLVLEDDSNNPLTTSLLEEAFGEYSKASHLYRSEISLETITWPYLHVTSPGLQEAIMEQNTSVICELLKTIKPLRSPDPYTLRLLCLAALTVRYIKIISKEDAATAKYLVDLLLQKVGRHVTSGGGVIRKKILAGTYKKMIDQVAGHYNSEIKQVKDVIDTHVPLSTRFDFGERELPVTEMADTLETIIQFTGNKLLYADMERSEWLVLLDFLKQYFHYEPVLALHRKISL